MSFGLSEHLVAWGFGVFLAALWVSRLAVVALNLDKVTDITSPEYDSIPQDASGNAPRVSIVVPARNEAEHIRAALLSLLELDYPDYEVVVIDDRSDDATGTILDQLQNEWRDRGEELHHRLKVIHLHELPPGWLGKPHAMWHGAKQASGEWILFTDADIVFGADALRRTMNYAVRERADHVVLFPTMAMHSLGERMMIGFFQSQFVFSHRPWKVSDPKSRDAIGVGAFNLIQRDVYEQIGTYRRLRLEVVDDMRLGEVVKESGFRQRVVFGRNLLRLRWFIGAHGMVRNLTKNGFAILRFNVGLTGLAVSSLLVVNVGPFVGTVLATGLAKTGFVVALTGVVAIYVGMSRHSDVPPYYFLLHPVGAFLFGYAIVRSAFLTLWHDGIDWRGTHYPLAYLRQFLREKPRRSWL